IESFGMEMGPLSLVEVTELANAGTLTERDRVRRGAGATWRIASDYGELRGALGTGRSSLQAVKKSAKETTASPLSPAPKAATPAPKAAASPRRPEPMAPVRSQAAASAPASA